MTETKCSTYNWGCKSADTAQSWNPTPHVIYQKLIAQPGQLRGEYSENFERFWDAQVLWSLSCVPLGVGCPDFWVESSEKEIDKWSEFQLSRRRKYYLWALLWGLRFSRLPKPWRTVSAGGRVELSVPSSWVHVRIPPSEVGIPWFAESLLPWCSHQRTWVDHLHHFQVWSF